MFVNKTAVIKEDVFQRMLLVFLLLCLFGFWSSVLVWPSVYRQFGMIGLYGSSIMIVLHSYVVLKHRKKKASDGVAKKLIAILFLYPIVMSLAMAKGVPSLLHHFDNQKASHNYVVTEVQSRKNCRNGFRVAEFTQLLNNKICKSPRGFYSQIERGSLLKIEGSESQFGFLPQVVEIIE